MKTTVVLLVALLALLSNNSCAVSLDNQKDGKQSISPQYQFGGLPGSNCGSAGDLHPHGYLHSQRYPVSYYPGSSGSVGYGAGFGFPSLQAFGISSGSYGSYPQNSGFIPPYQYANMQGGFPMMFRKKENSAREEQHGKLQH